MGVMVVTMLNAVSLYVAVFYSLMTIISILGADDLKDLLLVVLVIMPPAFLGLATFMRF